MVKQTVEYTNNISFHIRPIGTFTNEVKKTDSSVTVTKNELTVPGNKAMQLLRLCIVKGDFVTIEVNGPDEEALLERLVKILLGGE
ncbi:MAG: HPr family phosphocarrier protein [Tenericutes bacterium]|nr:HPr family phosphocarrier protein [Mycoplasmatota bacterium]